MRNLEEKDWFYIFLIVLVLASAAAQLFGAERIPADEYFGDKFFTQEIRNAYENSSGSCVYMSTAAAGINQNLPLAWTLPWTTDYGPACRGGATPSSFEANARERGLKALNITGEETYDYMRWGIQNGYWVAIGAGTQHFQTLVGYNDQGTESESDDTWDVWNCNMEGYVIRYNNREFQRLHEASGEWCIVLAAYPDRPGKAKQQAK